MIQEYISVGQSKLLDTYSNMALDAKLPDFAISGDHALALSLRILLLPRIGDNILKCKYHTCSYSAEQIINNTDSGKRFGQMVSPYLSDVFLDKDAFSILSWLPWDDSIINSVDTEICGAGFSCVEDLSLYLSQFVPSRVYINADTKTTLLLVQKVHRSFARHIASVIPRLFPWYFADSGTDDIRQFIQAIMDETTPDKLIAIADAVAEPYDFRRQWLMSTLTGMESSLIDRQIQEQREISAASRRHISEYMAYINNELQNQRNADERILSLKARQRSGEKSGAMSELTRFISTSENIHVESIDDTTITFIVTGYLDSYDRDEYIRIRDNEDSYLNEFVNSDDEYDSSVTVLLDALYYESKPLLKLRTCSVFKMNLRGGIHAPSGWSFADQYNQTHLPNPHLYHHGCLGGHEPMLAQAMSDLDFTYAMQIAIAANSNISFSDSTVGEELCEDLSYYLDSSRVKCIELPDGTCCTCSEALAWLTNH